MSPTNREIQLRKTCQLYAYVLRELGREVPEEIEECADAYDYPVECMRELAETIQGLDGEHFEKIVNGSEAQEARDLARWWQMYQAYIPLDQ